MIKNDKFKKLILLIYVIISLDVIFVFLIRKIKYNLYLNMKRILSLEDVIYRKSYSIIFTRKGNELISRFSVNSF